MLSARCFSIAAAAAARAGSSCRAVGALHHSSAAVAAGSGGAGDVLGGYAHSEAREAAEHDDAQHAARGAGGRPNAGHSEEAMQRGGRDYGAPYSAPSHEDEQARAASDSAKQHPRGAADTSGMNSPAGRAGSNSGSEQPQQQQSQQQQQQQQQQSQQQQDASMQQAAGDAERLDGGASGGVAGAWRAMTADFAAGGDDLSGSNAAGTLADDSGMGTPVNPVSGLPASEQSAGDDASEAGSGFGRLRPPGESREQSETARQFERSTGQTPADASSG